MTGKKEKSKPTDVPLPLVSDLTIDQCFQFIKNPSIHPFFKTNIEINSLEYKNIVEICGKKMYKNIFGENEEDRFPLLSEKERKKVFAEMQKEENIFDNTFTTQINDIQKNALAKAKAKGKGKAKGKKNSKS